MNTDHDPASTPDTTPAGEAASGLDRRVQALRCAATAKRDAATTRADRAIRELATSGAEITFRSVARTGGISLDFLYATPELRSRIQALRTQASTRRTPAPASAAETTTNAITSTLTAKLHQERATRRSAVDDLEERLAAAHGELLRLRRILDQHGIQT